MDYAGHPEPAQETVRERKDARGRASVRADVARHEDARALIRACVEDFDPLDILVNYAGVEDQMPFLETPPEIREKVIGVNLTGPWRGSITSQSSSVTSALAVPLPYPPPSFVRRTKYSRPRFIE